MMERPWPEAGRELERIAAHICEILPEVQSCVSYGDEGVQLRLFIPDGAAVFDMQFDDNGARLKSIALESARGGGRVDMDALLDRLVCYTPLESSVDFTRRLLASHTTVDINLRVPEEMRPTA